MRLLAAGVDTTVIALWLGHESVATTQIYIHQVSGIARANLRSLSVTNVALGSHELECPRLVAADPFCGFPDGLDVFHAE